MKPYKTFQEAKIANPQSEIYTRGNGFFAEKDIEPSHNTYEYRGFVKCNPADHCMAYNKFKNHAVDLRIGDWVIGVGKFAFMLNGEDLEDWNSEYRGSFDDEIYILRAAALEEKIEIGRAHV